MICARLHSLLTGGTGDVSAPAGSPWYLGGYQVLWQILDRHTLFCPMYLASDPVNYTREADTPCTREDFVRTVSYVLLDANVTLPQINAVSALPDVAEEDTFGSVSKDVLDLYRAGVLTGIDAYGTFRGTGTLNRGQAAAILARLDALLPGGRRRGPGRIPGRPRQGLGLGPSGHRPVYRAQRRAPGPPRSGGRVL